MILKLLKNQILNQTNLIKELKNKLSELEEEIAQHNFEKEFNEQLSEKSS